VHAHTGPGKLTIGQPIVELGNTHQLVRAKDGDESHKWKVYVRKHRGQHGQLQCIEKVVFHLHEDFDPPTVELRSPPYEVERIGWGTFDIKVEIHCSQGYVVHCEHELCFKQVNNHSLVLLGLDWS